MSGFRNKVTDARTALRVVESGSTLLAAGFGDAGRPDHLLETLREFNLTRLTVVSNNAGRGAYSLGGLISDGAVERMVCSFPKGKGAKSFREALDAGRVEMELIPQGIMTERLRAAGAGITAFYLPAPDGTDFALVEDQANIDGTLCQLYRPLRGDAGLIAGAVADTFGNVRCRLAARNFNPIMAAASTYTVAEVERIVEVGELAPDSVHIPGVLVDAVVLRPQA